MTDRGLRWSWSFADSGWDDITDKEKNSLSLIVTHRPAELTQNLVKIHNLTFKAAQINFNDTQFVCNIAHYNSRAFNREIFINRLIEKAVD